MHHETAATLWLKIAEQGVRMGGRGVRMVGVRIIQTYDTFHANIA